MLVLSACGSCRPDADNYTADYRFAQILSSAIDGRTDFGIMDSMNNLNNLTSYNGWTNYPTWLTNLHFYDDLSDLEAIKQYIEERIDDVDDTFVKDLATFAFELIDWQQIEDHLK